MSTRILSEEDEIDIKPLNAVQISLFSFLMLLPQLEIIDGVFQLVSNPDAGALNGLTTTTGTLSRFGATSLFVTFILSWYSTRIYAICVQKHIVIKLPDVVPAGVANSFTSLIPVFFVAIVNMLVQGVFLAADIFNPFIYMGGSGCTLMLAVFLFGLAKSEQLRAIGKAEIVSAFFNINEPILFGLPIVYNPNMVIPFIVVPLCTALLTYLEFQIGLIPPLTVSSPWCSPAPLSAFLGSAGSWTAVLCSLVNIAVSGLLWFPFFKRYDNKLYAEEQEKLAEEKAAAAAK